MRKFISLISIILLVNILFGISTYADTTVTDTSSVIEAMEDAKSENMAGESNISKIINTIIGLLQITGTGISIIVVTLLGIKYLMASPSEKADTKKSIIPIAIGCVLLFGAVNLMSAVYDFATKTFE